MHKNLNLIYWGGSGGFYLFFQLMLTKQFICHFDFHSSNEVDIWEIINDQFNIERLDSWKKLEYWPNNELTKKIYSDQKKIYYYCNQYKDFDKDSSNIFLYTDYKSQIRLASAKKAYHWKNGITLSKLKQILSITHKDLLLEVFCTKFYLERLGGISVTLQEITNAQGLSNFFKKIDLEINEENIKFLTLWKSLHPPDLLKKVGIDPFNN